MPYSGFTRKGYEESVSLKAMAEQVTKLLPDVFTGLPSYHIMFTKTEPEELAGKCRHLDGAVKHITGLDFLILVHKDPFKAMDIRRKYRVICHELYHMERDKGSWKVRHHEGDFCEIEAHDRFSFNLADRCLNR